MEKVPSFIFLYSYRQHAVGFYIDYNDPNLHSGVREDLNFTFPVTRAAKLYH